MSLIFREKIDLRTNDILLSINLLIQKLENLKGLNVAINK